MILENTTPGSRYNVGDMRQERKLNRVTHPEETDIPSYSGYDALIDDSLLAVVVAAAKKQYETPAAYLAATL